MTLQNQSGVFQAGVVTVALYLTTSLTSCAVTQPGSAGEQIKAALPETTAVPDNFKQAATAAINDVNDGWLKSFGDPALEAIVGEAVKNNLDLQAASARVDRAAALAVQAGAELAPAIGLGGSSAAKEGFSSSDPSLNTNGLALNMSWEVDLWGRVRSQAKAGKAQYEATQYQLQWAYQSLAAQTSKLWFLVTEISLQQKLAEDALALQQQTLGLVEAKHEQGKVTAREVALARASTAQAKSAIHQIGTSKEQASRALETVLGRYPAAQINGAEDLVATPPPIPVGIPSELLERRPDLQSAERAVAANFLQIQSAKAARLPKISLTGAVGNSSGELENVVSLGSDFWSVGANFMAPIFTGGALAAQVDIQKASFQEALANYGSLALRAFSEVEQGLSNESSLREQEVLQREILAESTEALRVANAQFEVGRVDLLSVLQQQAQVIGAQSALFKLRDARLHQRIDLHLALGGSFKPSEEN